MHLENPSLYFPPAEQKVPHWRECDLLFLFPTIIKHVDSLPHPRLPGALNPWKAWASLSCGCGPASPGGPALAARWSHQGPLQPATPSPAATVPRPPPQADRSGPSRGFQSLGTPGNWFLIPDVCGSHGYSPRGRESTDHFSHANSLDVSTLQGAGISRGFGVPSLSSPKCPEPVSPAVGGEPLSLKVPALTAAGTCI